MTDRRVRPGAHASILACASAPGRNLTYCLLILVCWSATHRYQGLGYDAQLYAFQALAQIHPALNLDLFLLNSSQDRFSAFSPFYAQAIRLLGVERAALTLMLLFSTAFLIGAWFLMRRLTDASRAWLAIALLVIIPGDFGAFNVIRYAEPFLTARTAAEALVIIALALCLRSRPLIAAAVIAVAFFFHPIMALPGLLMLVCLWLPMRLCVAAAGLGVIGALALAAAATADPRIAQWVPLLDPDWLYVVRERSQYLLLDLWTVADWKVNAKPFIALLLTVLAVPDERIRRLSLAAMLVGVTGLAVAAIGCALGPVAILVQSQPWRFVWITLMMAVLLLPATVMALWREPRVGPLCAALAALVWAFPVAAPLELGILAAVIWTVRDSVTERMARGLRWLAAVVIAIVVVCLIVNVGPTLRAPVDAGHESPAVQMIRNILAQQGLIFILACAFWWWIARRAHAGLMASAAALAVALALLLPSAFRQISPLSDVYSPGEFADWQRLIPENKSVVIANQNAASLFIWFVLQRASYLTESQSSGVVFARATALEVRRRSEVLAPLLDPNWKIFSALTAYSKDRSSYHPPGVHPLTAAMLVNICADPLLGFLIAPEDVGFGTHRHIGHGIWSNWNLYDCDVVRATRGPTPGG